jgi:hypothetical protein
MTATTPRASRSLSKPRGHHQAAVEPNFLTGAKPRPKISEAITKAAAPRASEPSTAPSSRPESSKAIPGEPVPPEPRGPPPHHCRAPRPPRPSLERCCAPSLEVLHEAQSLPKIS